MSQIIDNDKYIDPENSLEIIEQIKTLPTLGDVKRLSEQIFPDWWAEFTASPAEGSENKYGAQFWKQNDEEFPNVPKDMYFADGFQGQRIFIIPSKNLVVVRFGLSNKGDISYDKLLKEIIEAVE